MKYIQTVDHPQLCYKSKYILSNRDSTTLKAIIYRSWQCWREKIYFICVLCMRHRKEIWSLKWFIFNDHQCPPESSACNIITEFVFKSLSRYLCWIVTVALAPVMEETQQPEADNKDNAEYGIDDAQEIPGSVYLLLVLFSLAFFYWLFKPYKH